MGWVVGVCRHTGAWGYGVAAPTPSCPVPPGTGVCQVCSAWSSSTVPAAVPGGGLWAQGAAQLLVVLVQKRGHHGVVPQACSASCQSTTATQCRWPEGCPTLLGCRTVAQPREHQPGHEELLVSTTPRVNWVLLALQAGTALGKPRGDGNSQHQFVTVTFCQTSPTSFSIWLLGSAIREAKSTKPSV